MVSELHESCFKSRPEMKQWMKQSVEPVLLYRILEYLEALGLLNTVDSFHQEIAPLLTRETRTVWFNCINGHAPGRTLLQLWEGASALEQPPTPSQDSAVNLTKNGLLKAISVIFPGRTPESLTASEKQSVVNYFRTQIEPRETPSVEPPQAETVVYPQTPQSLAIPLFPQPPQNTTQFFQGPTNEAEQRRRVFLEQQRRIEEQLLYGPKESSDGFFQEPGYLSHHEITQELKNEKIQRQRVHLLNQAITLAEKTDKPLQTELPKEKEFPPSWSEPFVEIDFSDLLEGNMFGTGMGEVDKFI